MAILVQGKVMMAICRASGAELVERCPQLFALSNERGKLKLGFDGSRQQPRSKNEFESIKTYVEIGRHNNGQWGVLNFVPAPRCLQNNGEFCARAVRRPGSKNDNTKVRWRSWNRAGRHEVAYLRAAQAYMLISMPTGTSTIFGVFQAIRELPSPRHDCRTKIIRPHRRRRKPTPYSPVQAG
jgi:hypothetical protein